MIRVVSGFKIAWKYGPDRRSKVRFFVELEGANQIEKLSIADNVPVGYYNVVPCFLLEVQSERGEPTYFDLGSPVEIAR